MEEYFLEMLKIEFGPNQADASSWAQKNIRTRPSISQTTRTIPGGNPWCPRSQTWSASRPLRPSETWLHAVAISQCTQTMILHCPATVVLRARVSAHSASAWLGLSLGRTAVFWLDLCCQFPPPFRLHVIVAIVHSIL
eukprot:1177025-Rhodomonas_salina.2